MTFHAINLGNPEFSSIKSAGEQLWEYHAAYLNDIITRAYNNWPLNTAEHSNHRRQMLSLAMGKAEIALKDFAEFTTKEKGQLLLNYAAAFSADTEHCKETVRDFVGSWMHIFSNAIDNAQGAL